MIFVIFVLIFNGCGESSIEGNYIVMKDNKPYKTFGEYIVVTFGKKTFSLSTGAGGNYEITKDKVILTGGFSNTFTIKDDNLVNQKWFLKKSSNKEAKALLEKQKAEKEAKKKKREEDRKKYKPKTY